MKRKLKIIAYLLLLMIVAVACTDADMVDNYGGVELDENGLATVRLTVSIADAGAQTRDDVYNDDTQIVTISTGASIDMLLYAVYDVTDPIKDPELLEYYQANYGDEDKNKRGQGENYEYIKGTPKIGDGQTCVGFKAKDGMNPNRYTLILKVDPEKKYKVAFWAQNSGCKAYDTSDLTNVKVSYKKNNYPNNDESRDAFSGVSEIMGVGYVEQEVVLQRPFAQINIGTTGADYANLIYYELMVPNGITVTQSKVKIKGVANRYDVLNCWATTKKEDGDGETWIKDEIKENEYRLEAEFDWANLPAWINLNQSLPSREEAEFTYEKSKDKEDKDKDNRDDDPFVKLPVGNNKPLEAYLTVRLNEDTKDKNFFEPYLTDYDTVEFEKILSEDDEELKDEDGNIVYDRTKIHKYLTETFKYLSMCYVLVPTDTNDKGEPTGATVDLSFNLRQELNDKKDPIELTERTLYSVPVRANYRTNILGGLYDDILDPTSIFNFYQLPLILVEEIDTWSNSRYCSSNFEIRRPHNQLDEAGLVVTRIDRDPFGDEENGYNEKETVEKLSDDEIISFPVFFTGGPIEYRFEVNDGYEIKISSNVDNYKNNDWIENTWVQKYFQDEDWTAVRPDVEPGPISETRLIIYPGATASKFTISIEKVIYSSNEDHN